MVTSMNKYEKITESDIKINKDTVFHLIDCYPNSPIYEEVMEEYLEIEEKVQKLVEPKAFYKFGIVSESMSADSDGIITAGTPVIYVLMSVGDEIAEYSSELFAKGDYLLGMLVNAMADAYLFQIEDFLKDRIKVSCIERHLGIEKRFDAPSNIPMIIQKYILNEIKEEENLLINVTEGYMFTTVKTMGHILVLTDDETMVYAGHNCNSCNQKDCKVRKTEMQ